MKKLKIIFISIICISTVLFAISIPEINALPTNIEYTFDEDNLLNEISFINSTTFNIRNQTEYANHYNGTYSFENDIINSNPTGFTVDETGGTVNIIDSESNHSQVIELYDTNGAQLVGCFNDFTEGQQTSGTIEFWFTSTDTFKQTRLQLEGATTGIWILFAEDYIINRWSGGYDYIHEIENNIWYHIRINFNTDTDYFTLIINDTTTYINQEFYVNQTYLETLIFESHIGSQTYYSYFDAIGYSWDNNYNIGDNLIPYLSTTTITEPDKWEFSFTEQGTYTTYEPTVPFWTEINNTAEYVQGGQVRLYSEDTYEIGIYRDDFTITGGVLNISLDMHYVYSTTQEAVFYFEIFSADTTLITRLRFYSHLFDSNTINTLSYWDGGSYNNITTLIENTDYAFNIFINNNNVSLLMNRSLIETFTTLASKKGISEVKFRGNGGQYGDGAGMNRMVEIHIESIGIYSNGISISDDYFSSFFSTSLDWDSNEYSLFTADIEGNCSIVTGSTTSITPTYTLFEYQEFTDIKTICVYNEFTGGNEVEGWILFPNFNLTITSNSTLILNSITISSVFLTDGTNNYAMDISESNIDLTESYFYLDKNDYLNWIVITDDDNVEYLEVSFSITQNTEQYVFYVGQRTSLGYTDCYTRLIYTDTSTTTFTMSTNFLNIGKQFSQLKIIETIIVHISDDDNFNNKTITGYVTDFSFTYIYVPLNLVSETFMSLLPILFILIPIPIFMFYKFEKKPIVLLGTFFLMTLVGTITQLIPFWFMLIVILGMVGFFYKKGGLT